MIVIVGGGLAGLSTAFALGETPHVVLESTGLAGGLCGTRVLDGFHFDYTGHLLHLRDPRAIGLIDELLPGAFDVHDRKAFIRTRGVTLPFPFQANLHGLPPEVVAECILGAAEARMNPLPEDPEISFRDWSLAVLGKGISDAFMFPYNAKLFRRDPAAMTADWVSWAVPRPSLQEVVHGALGIVNRGLGYNATFRYPREGGIEVLPRAFARKLRSLRTGAHVVEIDLRDRAAVLATGERIRWDQLVVTSPLPSLLRMLRHAPTGLVESADRLDWSVVGCLNLGIAREGIGEGAHWIYFPDRDVPFYRVGFPSAMGKGVAPRGTSSLYIEFGLARDERPDPGVLEAGAIAALRQEGILRDRDAILVRDFIRIDPGYVIFDRARQEVMRRVPAALGDLGIHLIGRYGAWTYSYMERAILDGLEIGERLRR